MEETGSTGSSAPAISSSTATITDSNSPTTFVGIVPSVVDGEQENDPFDILAVHKDGRVRRLPSDLKSERWNIQHSEISKVGATHEVHTCFLIEFEDAKKALFKRRQDLATLALGDLTAEIAEPSILLLVSHPSGADHIALKDVSVQVFSVPADPESGSDESQRLRHLQTIPIPDLAGFHTVKASCLQWSFHSGSAGLNLSFEKGFINFDLSLYCPCVTSQFVLEDERFSSVMRISPQSVIGAGQSLVAVYDTQYQSVQRSIATRDVLQGVGSAQSPTIFLNYFSKLGIAVATKDNTLVAFDLSSLHSTSGPSLKRSRDGLLIDAIGRGIRSSATQWDVSSKKHQAENIPSLQLTSSEQVDKWNQLTKALTEANRSKDTAAFDQAVLAYFGSSEDAALPAPGQYVNCEATLFLLSKIFTVNDSSTDGGSVSFQVQVVLWPPTTCNWLIRLGHLSANNVEIALQRALKPRMLRSLPTGSFMQALIDYDPSLALVNEVLEGPALIPSDELAYTLKALLNKARFHSGTLEEKAPAITNGELGTPTQEIHLDNQTASLKEIFNGLNMALQKIHTQPLTAIIQSLRTTLSREEIMSLVHHLRLSLATGGYTSRFTENPPTPITIDQITPSLSLNTIIDLITASVDAIGPSGWISALPTLTDLDSSAGASRDMELIADMKSEVSAALAGVEEACYVKGILREYLRFANQVTTTTATTSDTQVNRDTTPAPSHFIRHEKVNGADVIVFTAPGEDGDGEVGGKMLPLSLKAGAASNVSLTKVKKSTGQVKTRSNREIGYLKRKAVGKYSFERLLV